MRLIIMCFTEIAITIEIIEGFQNFKNEQDSFNMFDIRIKSWHISSIFAAVIQKEKPSILAGPPCI